jgi:rsbT co-antagonist protein RsbR
VTDALSAPVIPLSDDMLVMPLIGMLDARRMGQVTTVLLEEITRSRAAVAIVDITGVPAVDPAVADALVRAAQAVRLLGATVVLTGIRPELAQTLVEVGVDLQGIVTCGTLRSGIEYARTRGRLGSAGLAIVGRRRRLPR